MKSDFTKELFYKTDPGLSFRQNPGRPGSKNFPEQ
jgi:hypothetical protein